MDSEKKLISVDDLKAKVEITDTDVCADYGDGFCQHGYSNQLLRLMINELPTVDAVEVVRCKDCKHYEETYPGYGYCYHWDYEDGSSPNAVESDDFCSSGAKMDGGDKA